MESFSPKLDKISENILYLLSLNSRITILELSNKWKIARLGKNKIDSGVLMYFAKSNNMDIDLVDAFIKFKPSVNGDDIMKEFGIKGRAVGEKINQLNKKKF